MIKRLLLSTVAIATVTGSALAADLPMRTAPPVYVPPPPIPTFTWTGFYIGAHAGYEFGHSDATAIDPPFYAANGSSPGGFVGGAHVGYNFSTQSLGMPALGGFGGGLVLGVEGDVDGSNYKTSYAFGPVLNGTRQDIQGSIRGRVGVAVDRALFYATGGAAFGDISTSYYNVNTTGFDTFDHTRVGYTVGGGVEYAFTNNLSARAEYRYTDYGSFTDTPVNSAPLVAVRHRETDNRIQAGISYKFDMFSPITPVVARY